MFLKSAEFKKLIKEAYSGPGLKFGNDGYGYYLSGGYWAIWIMKGFIPKKELGAIIELTGEMPEEGKGFKSTKDGNQYEIQNNPIFRVMENALECETELCVTPVLIKENLEKPKRILQNPGSRKILLVDEKFVRMIDNSTIDFKSGETPAEGPLIGKHAGVFWKNDIMAMHVMQIEDGKHEKLIKHLEEMEF